MESITTTPVQQQARRRPRLRRQEDLSVLGSALTTGDTDVP